jgi:hypothetical protein
MTRVNERGGVDAGRTPCSHMLRCCPAPLTTNVRLRQRFDRAR